MKCGSGSAAGDPAINRIFTGQHLDFDVIDFVGMDVLHAGEGRLKVLLNLVAVDIAFSEVLFHRGGVGCRQDRRIPGTECVCPYEHCLL
jgi:hypothetical protein